MNWSRSGPTAFHRAFIFLSALARSSALSFEKRFDRIEVGALGRQEHERHASRLDGVSHAGCIVGGEIVYDDAAAR